MTHDNTVLKHLILYINLDRYKYDIIETLKTPTQDLNYILRFYLTIVLIKCCENQLRQSFDSLGCFANDFF